MSAPTAQELKQLGLDDITAETLAQRVAAIWSEPDAATRWTRLTSEALSPQVPFAVHAALFTRNYAQWNRPYPPPAWTPGESDIRQANLTRFIKSVGLSTLDELSTWARSDPETYWRRLIETLGIAFRQPFTQAVDLSQAPECPRWLVGARLNIVESCFQHAAAGLIAIDESGRREQVSVAQLKNRAQRFAGALHARGLQPGDAVALVLPLSIEAVVAYLGTILAGCVAIGIAESFAAAEIERRARIGQAKLMVVQDSLVRAGKVLPVYARLSGSSLPPMVVTRCESADRLRSGDSLWPDFLASAEPIERVQRSPDDVSTILFSSGTTAEPKAIPWTHATPIQCAADAFLYQDVHPADVLAWPTGMGWMMGPWLIYAGLVNGAKVVLFDGHAATPAFVKCVEQEKVTVLGVVPSLVAAWQHSGAWDAADWRNVRLFSTTGECSHPEQMLALMSRAGYRPVIEYCGGTELAGGYLASTVLRPNAPACFNQPALGLSLSIRDDEDRPASRGEVFLAGASIGHSTRLLNGDHHGAYFADTPLDESGRPLRRHGDSIEELGNGYYRVLGRADDAMNLGGIKISAVEIERVCNEHPAVVETAAIAESDSTGGPSRLVIVAVLRDASCDLARLAAELQQLVRERLSPQFRISEVRPIDTLPRTASNKMMRRLLRGKGQD